MNSLANALLVSSWRRQATRTEDRPSAAVEEIDDAARERRLRADDGQVDALALGQREEGGRIGGIDGDGAKLGARFRRCRARRRPGRRPGSLRKPPAQRMLARARAHDQDSHLND